MDRHTLELPGPILFEVGSDRLSPASDEMLEIVHDYLDAKPDVTLLRIEGHTEGDGNAEANFVLSQKRALTVARWLTGMGVRCDRLLPVGFGASKELARGRLARAQGPEPSRRLRGRGRQGQAGQRARRGRRREAGRRALPVSCRVTCPRARWRAIARETPR